MKTDLIRNFIETRRKSLSLSPEIGTCIQQLCARAPEFCLGALTDRRTHVTQKAEILAGLTKSPLNRNQIIERLRLLSDDELLYVVDGLRKRRLNGRKTRELGLSVIVGHSRFAELAANHRMRIVRILKHLLGEKSWSSVSRFLRTPTKQEVRSFLNSKLLRFATDIELACEALCFLAGLGFDQPNLKSKSWLLVPWLHKKPEQSEFVYTTESLRTSVAARSDLNLGQGLPRQTLSGIRGTYHQDVPRRKIRELAAPAQQREKIDGQLTAAIKESLASNDETSLESIVARLDESNLPVVDVSTAIVLDMSGSMASSGERLYHPASLGLALVGLLQRHVRNLNVFQVGGSVVLNGQGLPRPQGASDLATAVLQAARSNPAAILIVTDGFENYRQGDVDQVVMGLKRLGRSTLVEQVTPVIAEAEDLSQRRLSASIPVVPIEHEIGVGELAARLMLAGQSETLENSSLKAVQQLLFPATNYEQRDEKLSSPRFFRPRSTLAELNLNDRTEQNK